MTPTVATPAHSWSFSKLGDFTQCKKMFFFKHIQRIPEPERPLPPGKLEHANDRGTRIHTSCELFINGTEPDLCPEADLYFGTRIMLLRELYKDGLVSLEGEWGMDREWGTTGWNGGWYDTDKPPKNVKVTRVAATGPLPERGTPNQIIYDGKDYFEWLPSWLRLKLDCMVMHSATQATVIDFKSGRKFGNEIKHAQQLQLYQLCTFMRFPELQEVTAELWYTDQNEVTSSKYTRMQGMQFMKTFDKRGHEVTSCTSFPANPNKHSCRFCPYGEQTPEQPSYQGTGHCNQRVI